MAGIVGGIAYLDGSRLRRGLRAGIRRVIADQERLNRINVFPVPDGDTGTNLAMTMQSVMAALSRHEDRHAGRTLELVADAALDGARGNSGAILAQFFLGLGDACGGLRLITTEAFVDAVQRGSDYARDAVSEPREGTVLSVLSTFADELQRIRGKGHDFAALLEQGLGRARTALAETTNQLEVLRKAGVVDAGAQGFVDLLQGVTDFVRDGSLRAPAGEAEALADEGPDHPGDGLFDNIGQRRFCTECIVSGESIDRRGLREQISTLGDSLVLAGTARKTRVHIHVDDPDAVFRIARQYGEISGQKADDMHLQQRAARVDRPAVVVDSAGDIAEEDVERLGIFIVPIPIHFGDKGYLDKITMTPDQFYVELERNPHHPKTSQPPPGDFRRLYQFLGSHRRAVVSIHVSSKVSGTVQAAESAAARSKNGSPVIVVDSKNASLGEGMIALYAAEMAAAGFDLDEITIRLADVVAGTRTYGLLSDLRYAVRGGRVPQHKKLLADFLRLHPVLTNFPDGRIGGCGFIFGRRRATEKLARFILDRTDRKRAYRLGVGHARSPREADKLVSLLLEGLPSVRSHYVTEVGTALGAHGGPGTLVVAVQEDLPFREPHE